MSGISLRPKHGNGDKFGRGMPFILCDLMPHGKRLIRGSPDNLRALWTFCPLKKFPNDKIKVSKCEECSHFCGYRKSFSNKIVQFLKEFGTLSRAFQVEKPKSEKLKSQPQTFRIKKPQESKAKRHISEDAITKEIEEKECRDKEWQEEEKRIFLEG